MVDIILFDKNKDRVGTWKYIGAGIYEGVPRKPKPQPVAPDKKEMDTLMQVSRDETSQPPATFLNRLQ